MDCCLLSSAATRLGFFKACKQKFQSNIFLLIDATFLFQTPKKLFSRCAAIVSWFVISRNTGPFSFPVTDEILAGGMGLDDDEQSFHKFLTVKSGLT